MPTESDSDETWENLGDFVFRPLLGLALAAAFWWLMSTDWPQL